MGGWVAVCREEVAWEWGRKFISEQEGGSSMGLLGGEMRCVVGGSSECGTGSSTYGLCGRGVPAAALPAQKEAHEGQWQTRITLSACGGGRQAGSRQEHIPAMVP